LSNSSFSTAPIPIWAKIQASEFDFDIVWPVPSSSLGQRFVIVPTHSQFLQIQT